jgi:hypothetical protein
VSSSLPLHVLSMSFCLLIPLYLNIWPFSCFFNILVKPVIFIRFHNCISFQLFL